MKLILKLVGSLIFTITFIGATVIKYAIFMIVGFVAAFFINR